MVDTDFLITSHDLGTICFWCGRLRWMTSHGQAQHYRTLAQVNRALRRMKRKHKSALYKNAKYIRFDEMWLDDNTLNVDLLLGRQETQDHVNS